MKETIKKIAPNWLWDFAKHTITKSRLKKIIKWSDDISVRDNGIIFLSDLCGEGKAWRGWEEYHSQFMQDYYIDTFCFKGMENGFFCDIGGNSPIWINNTYFFEEKRGWTGIAFDPLPDKKAKWAECRKTVCEQLALGKENGKLVFKEYEHDFMSGFASSADYDGEVRNQYEVDVRPLKEVLREKSIKHIDFVSLDVEGSEYEVLCGIDFSEVDISVFVIENNDDNRKSRRKLLQKNGYHLQAILWSDEVWVKNDFDFKKDLVSAE